MKTTHILAAIAPLALQAAARPQGTPTTTAPSTTYTITVGTPVGDGSPFFAIAPIPGVNGQLDWEDFSVADFCFDCALRPASRVNAVFGPQPSWSVDYAGSNAASFTLLSFAAGCSANQTYTPPPGATGAAATPGARPQPIPCYIVLTAPYGDPSKGENAAELFAYQPQTSVDTANGGQYPSAPLQTFDTRGYGIYTDIRSLNFSAQVAYGYEDRVLGDFRTEISEAVYAVKNKTSAA